MNEVCSKCKTDCAKKGTIFIEAMERFYLCILCTEVVENMPYAVLKIHHFLDDKKCNCVDNKILRDMILARMRRANDKRRTPNRPAVGS